MRSMFICRDKKYVLGDKFVFNVLLSPVDRALQQFLHGGKGIKVFGCISNFYIYFI